MTWEPSNFLQFLDASIDLPFVEEGRSVLRSIVVIESHLSETSDKFSELARIVLTFASIGMGLWVGHQINGAFRQERPREETNWGQSSTAARRASEDEAETTPA